jgi:hypothetical protein
MVQKLDRKKIGLSRNQHLTKLSQLDYGAERTYRGQASFAQPSLGRTCGQCDNFSVPDKGGYTRCGQYKVLTGRRGEAIPPFAIACKYFVLREKLK